MGYGQLSITSTTRMRAHLRHQVSQCFHDQANESKPLAQKSKSRIFLRQDALPLCQCHDLAQQSSYKRGTSMDTEADMRSNHLVSGYHRTLMVLLTVMLKRFLAFSIRSSVAGPPAAM